MKLSQAILLGDSLRRRNAHTYISDFGDGPCGCALGGALLAIGETIWLQNYVDPQSYILAKTYPWFSKEVDIAVSGMFFELMWRHEDRELWDSVKGTVHEPMTIEMIADYVRSIEPDCDCGRFDCNCSPKQAEEVQAEYVTAS
jgi:hypothetical protein